MSFIVKIFGNNKNFKIINDKPNGININKMRTLEGNRPCILKK